MAKFNPFGVVIAVDRSSAALILAGREIQPSGMPAMIQGIILFALIASEVLLRYRVRFVRRVEGLTVDPMIIISAGVRAARSCCSRPSARSSPSAPGVLNLGVEGMMLIGAVVGLRDRRGHRQPVARAAGGACSRAALLSLLHGVVTIHFQADQVVSGLALTLPRHGPGAASWARASKAGTGRSLLPDAHRARCCRPSRSSGPIFFTNQSVLAYVGYLLVPVAWYWINRTRPGLHLRAVGENPTAADALGVNVYRLRYGYVIVGGLLAGLAGATITLAIQPGWYAT